MLPAGEHELIREGSFMTRFHDKAEGRTKQIVGQMIGDDKLVQEGKEEERKSEKGQTEAARDRPVGNRERKPGS
jgi:uncharacterized protein YjbJ (UPF0337 family)